ncbi:hypothetical protein [Nonomuraea africana]|uniref:DUF2178 domain-containing protein n=1 Tax=Nonomuraea africana TaxID=46171 RepID=A0ABR9KE36_9ACTN|nr:hypothetical protein [Nonomuraea africana]MBE1560249.1 hypothetical protein [Nonomuraea africana]
MSFEEKRVWIYALVALGVPVVYFLIVLGQLPTTEVTQIGYVRPMLIAIGVAIAANLAGVVVAAFAAPREANKKDERDAHINRYGQHVEYYVLAVGAMTALGLTLAGVAHFWIANALYLAFVLSAFTSSVVKIVAYRRGF